LISRVINSLSPSPSPLVIMVTNIFLSVEIILDRSYSEWSCSVSSHLRISTLIISDYCKEEEFEFYKM